MARCSDWHLFWWIWLVKTSIAIVSWLQQRSWQIQSSTSGSNQEVMWLSAQDWFENPESRVHLNTNRDTLKARLMDIDGWSVAAITCAGTCKYKCSNHNSLVCCAASGVDLCVDSNSNNEHFWMDNKPMVSFRVVLVCVIERWFYHVAKWFWCKANSTSELWNARML